MMRLHRIRLFLLTFLMSVCLASVSFGQQYPRNNFGIQFKPVISGSLLNDQNKVIVEDGIEYSIKRTFGYSLGMVVRKDFTKTLSLETGINFIRRNHELKLVSKNLTNTDRFGIVSYEIPLSGLVYIRLFENIYMNNSLGIAVELYPSNIETTDTNYMHVSRRKSWILPGVVANVGLDFRTKNSGKVYLGATFKRPFSKYFISHIRYNNKERVAIGLSGSFFTADLRYFFPVEEKADEIKNYD